VFDNRADADRAQDELLASGFSRQDVRLSNSDPTGATDSVSGTTTTTTGARSDEGIGASIKHFFSDIFGTDNSEHAQRYSTAVSRGHHVLTVSTDSEPEVERAADIVERHGPVDIDEKSAEWGGGAAIGQRESMRMSGAGGMQQSASLSQQSEGDRNLYAQQSLNDDVPMGQTYQEPMGSAGSLQSESLQGGSLKGSAESSIGLQGSSQRDTTLSGSMQRDISTEATTSKAIPVVQEELKIGKREVQRGGVRIFSRLVETPVNETIGLREEHVNVQRRTVDQPISPADATAFKEQTIELRETAEEPVVEKSARVVEEVVVGKEVSQREQQISDSVRHTEVEVEQLGAGSTSASTMADEDYYRRHWTSNFSSAGGKYEDYAPAYSYGSEMRSSDRYRGREWNDVESDLRSDWDKRYPGGATGSTWERMKAAVRHGWDRITS
jgi:uncharacterized protein (TIGR02271 family)